MQQSTQKPEDCTSAASEPGKLYPFCMVQFKDGGASYIYLTGGLTLVAGDFVVVPVGEYEVKKLARVQKVFTCAAQDAPYPPEKAKSVLRKSAETSFPKKKPAAAKPTPEPLNTPAAPPAAKETVPAQPVVKLPAAEKSEAQAPKTAPAPEAFRKKRRIPWRWLLAALAAAAFLIFALPSINRAAEAHRQAVIAREAEEQAKLEREAARKEELRLREEAKLQRLEEEAKAAIQAERRAGIPYVGMPESSIDATSTLGAHGMAKSGWAYTRTGSVAQKTYYWFTDNRTTIFTALCEGGKVIETQKVSDYWSGNTLLVPVITPNIPTSFNSGASSSNSGSSGLREEYDSPEDLYTDNPWDYADEDEAWEEWEND